MADWFSLPKKSMVLSRQFHIEAVHASVATRAGKAARRIPHVAILSSVQKNGEPIGLSALP